MKNRRIRSALAFLLVLTLVFSENTLSGFLGLESALSNAAEAETYCGKEEHEHDEDCYEKELICNLEESDGTMGHSHDSSCYETQTTLICGQEESAGHTHSEACYEITPASLICGQEESAGHTHTDDCWETTLICGMEEGEDHTHTDDCWMKTLICGQEEGAGHTHTDACWSEEVRTLICGQEESEGHTHTDACYKTEEVLICGQEEAEPSEGHTHTADCYEVTDKLICSLEEHEHSLSCYSNPNADTETAADWEATLPKDLTGIWAEDVVRIAQSQICYRESTENYEVKDNDVIKGYTRYGAWYGMPYEDWCAMFASFCLHYAGVPTDLMPEEAEVVTWISDLEELNLYENAEFSDYVPEPGDLVFFDNKTDDNVIADHVGIAEQVTYTTDENGDEVPVTLITIEGNSNNSVERNTYSIDSSAIVGYGKLPEQPGLGGTETGTESETETETETAAESETETETEAETETEEESETEEQTETEAETETEIESEIKTYAAGDTAFAIYCADDGSLTFYAGDETPAADSEYNGKTATYVYTGFDSKSYSSYSSVPWYSIRTSIATVTFDESFDGIQPVSLAYWFYGDTILTSVNGIQYLDTSEVTSLYYTFYNCSQLASLDVSGWDTSNVTTMYCAFYNCGSLTALDVSKWDVSSSLNLGYMFGGDSVLTELDVSNWDTSSVTSMAYMFYGDSTLTELNVSNWDTSHVESMASMFYNCSSLRTIYSDDSNFVTTAVTAGSSMFYGCTSLVGGNGTVYDGNEITSSMAHCDSPYNAGYFTGEWNISDVFAVYCEDDGSLTFYDDPNFDPNSGEYNGKVISRVYAGFDSMVYGVNTNVPWYSIRTNIVTVSFDESFKAVQPVSLAYWFYGMTALTDITGTKYLDTSKVTSLYYAFYNCSSLTSLDLSSWDTSSLTSSGLQYVFRECSGLTSLNVSTWDTSDVTSLYYAFRGCSSLTELDLSGWDTSKVTDMRYTFYGCSSLTTIYVDESKFVTAAVTTGGSMFTNCTSLVGGNGTVYDSSKVTYEMACVDTPTQIGYFTSANDEPYTGLNIFAIYSGDDNSLTFYHDEDAELKNGKDYKEKTVTIIYVGFDTATYTSASSQPWYNIETEITTVVFDESFKDVQPVSMSYWFRGMTNLTSVVNPENLDTSNATTMQYMFYNCSSLTTLNISSWNTANVSNMSYMFYGCSSLKTIYSDDSVFVTSGISRSSNGGYMFQNCTSLVGGNGTTYSSSNYSYTRAHVDTADSPGYFTGLKYSDLDVFAVYSEDDNSLTFYHNPGASITLWDDYEGKTVNDVYTGFDTRSYASESAAPWNEIRSDVKTVIFDESFADVQPVSMAYWFSNMARLTYVTGIEYLDTSSVASFYETFYNCSSLTDLDVSRWNTSNVSVMDYAFANCKSLTSLAVDQWDISNVTSLYQTFYNCGSIAELDVSNWDTSGITTLNGTFYGCHSLSELDVSSWDTGNVTTLNNTFYDCSNLTSLNVGNWDTSKVSSMQYTFAGCSSLETIYSDDANVVTTAVYFGNDMFMDCVSLVGGNGTVYDSSNVSYAMAHVDTANNPGYFTRLEKIVFAIYSADDNSLTFYTDTDLPDAGSAYNGKTVTVVYTEFEDSVYTADTDVPWADISASVQTVIIDSSFRSAEPASLAYWFAGMTNLTDVNGTANISISNVTSLSHTFYSCEKLTSVDVSTWDTSSVTDMTSMFEGCFSLTTIYSDDSVFVTTAVTSGDNMFTDCESLVGEDGTSYTSSSTDYTMAHVDTVEDPGYFTSVTLNNTISITDEKGLSLVIRINENDPSDDAILYTGESVAIVIDAENHSDAAYSGDVFRIYFQFDNDDYTMPTNFTDGATIIIHTTATVDGNSYDVEINLGIHYVGDGLWCWEIDGSELVPGLTLDYNTAIYYANGTSGGTMTVFAEFVPKEDATEDYTPSQPMDSYETVTATWATEAGTFSVSKSNYSTPAIAVTENEDGTSSYYLKNVSYTIQPKISSNSNNNSYGADYVTRVSYDDVLVLGEGLAWADGIIEAVENGDYYGVAGGYSSNTYHRYIYVLLDGEEYLLCDIRCGISNYGGDVAQNMDTYLYVNDAGDLCLHWEIDNQYTSGTAATIYPSSFSIIYSDGAVVITNPEEFNELSSYEVSNSVEATATLRDSGDQSARDEVDEELTPSEGTIAVSKSRSGDTSFSMYLGQSSTYTVTARNSGMMPYSGFRYLYDGLSTYLYILPDEMQNLFDTDYTHSLTITISSASLCDPTYTSEDYRYDYGPEVTDSSLIQSDATIVFTWQNPEDEEDNTLLMTVNGTDTYTIGSGCTYETIEAALDAIGYVVTRYASYALLWDFGEDYLLAGNSSVSFTYKASLKNSFMYISADQRYSATGDDSDTIYKVSGNGTNLNTVYARNSSNSNLANAYVRTNTIYRDFYLYKDYSVYRNNSAVSDDTLYTGDVIQYQVKVENASRLAYTDLPFEDQMNGGQVLIVPVSYNSGMIMPDGVSLDDLTIMTFNNRDYYVLDQAGTYENVVFAGASTSWSTPRYTGTIVVSKTSAGQTETMIYSSMDFSASTSSTAPSRTLYYYALVNAQEGVDLNDDDKTFSLVNYFYLNDHETHRLYDYIELEGNVLTIDKEIVTEKGETPEEDEVTKTSTLTGGDEVTYRLALIDVAGFTEAISITGEKIYDELPETIESLPWTSDRISIYFELGTGSHLYDSGGTQLSDAAAQEILDSWAEGWYITGEGTGYFIRWNSGLSMTFDGVVYIYVTLQYPEGDDWTAFAEEYHNGVLTNIEYAYGMVSSVDHRIMLMTTTTAWLQKGVYDTGYYYPPTSSSTSYAGASVSRTSEDGLWYYTNDAGYYNGSVSSSASSRMQSGYVRYYTAIYNTGSSNLYLNEIQDVLPKGFTLITDTYSNSSLNPVCSTNITLHDQDGNESICVTFDVASAVSEMDSGQQKVTFKLSTDETEDQTLRYDTVSEKYYLAPGEAAVILYCVRTNAAEDTQDAALNTAAMASYSEDYDGGGVTKYDGTVTATWSDAYGRTHNDGGCDYLDSDADAAGLGMTTEEESNMWLMSDVTVYRGSSVPGISKTAGQAAAANHEELSWTVTAYNDGDGVMQGYTITDVIQYPYTFTGELTYTVVGGTSDYSTSRTTLPSISLTFYSRSSDYVTIRYRGTTSSSTVNSKNVYINGDPVTFDVYFSTTAYSHTSVTVAIKTDETGNEILSLTFPDEEAAIYPGGYGTLTLKTNNTTTNEYNATFYNTAYVTPSEDFSQYEVIHGTYVNGDQNEYVDGNSVRAAASTYVTYGHATTSEKTVTELDGDGNLTTNSADSEATDYSATYITLADEDSVFRYTLVITNGDQEDDTNYAMNRLVIIDNLPEIGDYYTANDVTARGSMFEVVLAANPSFEVQLDGETLTEGTDYYIEYSNKENYFTTNDWSGSSSSDWYSEPTESTRSFRVVFLFGGESSVDMILTGSVVTVSFNAVISEAAKEAGIDPSSIAWNSFGYQYTVNASSTAMTASPMEVGVQVPTAPVLQKTLQDANGNSATAPTDMTFDYIIYPGNAALSEWTTEEELIDLLAAAGIEIYTKTSVTVTAGASQSEEMLLKANELKTYSTSNGEEIDTSWTWDDGSTYTIVELPQQDTEFASWNTTTRTNSYTFTYSNGVTFALTNANVYDNRTLTIKKTDTDGEELKGATFTLTREADGTVYYYDGDTGEWTTDTDAEIEIGSVVIDKPVDGNYTLKEVKAPKGYLALGDSIHFTIENGTASLAEGSGSQVSLSQEGDSILITVANDAAQTLPNTGGPGTWMFTISGLLILLAASYLMFLYRKKYAIKF